MEDDIFKERAANEEAFAQRRRKCKREGAEGEDTRAAEAARRGEFLDALQDAGCTNQCPSPFKASPVDNLLVQVGCFWW